MYYGGNILSNYEPTRSRALFVGAFYLNLYLPIQKSLIYNTNMAFYFNGLGKAPTPPRSPPPSTSPSSYCLSMNIFFSFSCLLYPLLLFVFCQHNRLDNYKTILLTVLRPTNSWLWRGCVQLMQRYITRLIWWEPISHFTPSVSEWRLLAPGWSRIWLNYRMQSSKRLLMNLIRWEGTETTILKVLYIRN